MRFIKCGIDFVKDVHWCGLELEESHDEREGDERALAA
jgi:hypothetical protein